MHGTGIVMGALQPGEASSALQLDRAPTMPILVGWQADGGRCVALFTAAADGGAVSGPASGDLGELGPGDDAAAARAPRVVRLTGQNAALALAPAARVVRSADGACTRLHGLVRVSAGADPVELGTPLGSLVASGLALADVGDGVAKLWCASGSAQVGATTLAPGEMAVWHGAPPRSRPFRWRTSRMRCCGRAS